MALNEVANSCLDPLCVWSTAAHPAVTPSFGKGIIMKPTSIILLLLVTASSWGADPRQEDWSGGPGDVGPRQDFGSSFAECNGISWLTVPGQLALSSWPLDDPIRVELADWGPRGAYGLATVDIDDDGDTDILGTTDAKAGVLLWRNEGTSPPSWEVIEIDGDFSGGTSLHPADIDLDGDFDIVGAAQSPGHKVSWWRNDATDFRSWQRFDIETFYPVACNVFAADVDADGWQDVMSTSWSFGTVNLWRLDVGDEMVWTPQTLADGQGGAHSAVAEDLDGDGDLEIVATAATVNSIMVFWNDGNEPIDWTREVLGDNLVGVRYAATADIDASGTPDVVAAAADGQVVWWANDGGPLSGWARHTIDTECFGGHWVDLEDIDGDGHIDVLVAAYVAGSIHWYGNDGEDPPNWSKHTVAASLSSPLTAVAADIDGMGDLEVIGSIADSGAFAWWEVSEFVATGDLTSTILDLGDRLRQPELTWQAQVPPSTTLEIDVRTGDDPETMGSWERIFAPGALPFTAGRYLQYRIQMSTEDAAVSPLVREIRVRSKARDGDESQRAPGPMAAR